MDTDFRQPDSPPVIASSLDSDPTLKAHFDSLMDDVIAKSVDEVILRLRNRPKTKRRCFGYTLDLTRVLPPNFPITAAFPWLHSPLSPPPTMQKPPNAAHFCPPPDAAGL
jgi:hypothetical protein